MLVSETTLAIELRGNDDLVVRRTTTHAVRSIKGSAATDRQPHSFLGVPARDAQIILGHSRLAVTLEIYTHEDRQAQYDALKQISDALNGDRHTSTP